jgi:hypothetical protein
VDWGGRRIWVRRSVGSGGRFQQPKTRGSVRAIAVTPTLVSALRLHRMASGFKGEEDLIFPSERGTPPTDGTWSAASLKQRCAKRDYRASASMIFDTLMRACGANGCSAPG